MRSALVLIAFTALASGCTPSQQAKPPEAGPEPQGEAAAPAPSTAPEPGSDGPTAPAEQTDWERFVEAWNSSDLSALAGFTTDDGLLVLDNPGAFVRVERFASIAALKALPGNFDRARLKEVRLKPSWSSEPLASPDCSELMTQSGVHRAAVERFRLSIRVKGLIDAEVLSKQEGALLVDQAMAIESTARFAVYDLDNNVGFLFGGEGGRLRLLAIDAVIPCSA